MRKITIRKGKKRKKDTIKIVPKKTDKGAETPQNPEEKKEK